MDWTVVNALTGCLVERGRDAQREDVRPACSSPKPVSAGFRICKLLAWIESRSQSRRASEKAFDDEDGDVIVETDFAAEIRGLVKYRGSELAG
jgi:hypothetical protein